ncbi:MAG: CsbD family protein [Pseudonocardiaceae bacterium]
MIDVAVLLTAQPPYEVLQLAYDHREETSMGIFDKAKDKVEQLIGEAKEKIGQMTGNERLENAGNNDQLSGEVKEAGHDLRDGAAGAVDDVKEKFRDDNK